MSATFFIILSFPSSALFIRIFCFYPSFCLYYFNSKNNSGNKLITFVGESSTINAYSLLKILDNFEKDFHKGIMLATFIENRRWNLLLEGSLLLKLSETDMKQSIENYIKLTNNLSYNNLIDVKMIDLRDPQKAVIEYK